MEIVSTGIRDRDIPQIKKHTPGALRAANLVMTLLKWPKTDRDAYRESVAQLIDNETAAPELLEALRNAMGILATIRNDGYAGIALPQLDWILDGDETGDSTAVIALEKATGE